MNKNTIWGVKFIYIFMYLLILINRLKIKSKEMSKDFPQTITEMDSWSWCCPHRGSQGIPEMISNHLVMAGTGLNISDGREALSKLLPCCFFKRYEQTFCCHCWWDCQHSVHFCTFFLVKPDLLFMKNRGKIPSYTLRMLEMAQAVCTRHSSYQRLAWPSLEKPFWVMLLLRGVGGRSMFRDYSSRVPPTHLGNQAKCSGCLSLELEHLFK